MGFFKGFFERNFGISPDGGDGSLEIMLTLLVVMILFAIWLSLPTSKKTKYDVRKREKRY